MQKSACFLIVVFITLLPLPLKAVQVGEYELKTAYLYNFALFTTWPADFPPEKGDSMLICTMGEDRFGSSIEQLQGRKIRGKKLVVRRGVDLEQASSCHMLYIAENDHEKLAGALEALRGKSVLTIGDIPETQAADTTGAADNSKAIKPARCMIMLILEDKRLMFEVDSVAARQAGLTMSSRLLYLARHIY